MSQSGSFLAGGGGSNVLTLTGNSGGAVGPTGGNINVVGSGFLSVVGNPGTSTLTISDSGLTALQGDTGSTTTASTVIIDFSDCGATTTTVSGANNVTFKVTSLVNNNTFVGHNSGGSVNLAVATQNTCFGQEALDRITTGSFNLAFGYRAGHNYTGAENSNLTIGNNLLGTTGESGVIRLGGGNSGGSKTFIAGITGITPVNAGALVNIIDSAGQLGTITNGTAGFVLTSNGGGTNPSFQASAGGGITTIAGDTGSATGATVTFNAVSQAGSSVTFSAAAATVSLNVTDANENTIIGLNSGNLTITGNQNIGLGGNVLTVVSSGIHNVAMGYFALGSITADNSNTAIGNNALGVLNGGSSNTALGESSLQNLATGSSNIALGESAGGNYTAAESNNIIIGNGDTAAESNKTKIGYIGGAASQTGCSIDGIFGKTVGVVTGIPVVIDTTGLMGTVVSSKRFKDNIKSLQSTKVLNLDPVSFNMIKDESKAQCIGLIAEDVAQIIPEMVVYKDGEPLTVKYQDLPIYLLHELKLLRKEFDTLKKECSCH